jgi:hypothetical protein
MSRSRPWSASIPHTISCSWTFGGDLGKLSGSRFDLISAFDVLRRALRAGHPQHPLHAQARRGLRLLGQLPARRGRADPHQVSRSLGESESALRSSGLEIVERAPMFALMNFPIDSRSRRLRRSWQRLASVVSLHEAIGSIVGACLYPLELLCVRLAKEGPSTELMICRRAS